jgi:hypothetical protein
MTTVGHVGAERSSRAVVPHLVQKFFALVEVPYSFRQTVPGGARTR